MNILQHNILLNKREKTAATNQFHSAFQTEKLMKLGISKDVQNNNPLKC